MKSKNDTVVDKDGSNFVDINSDSSVNNGLKKEQVVSIMDRLISGGNSNNMTTGSSASINFNDSSDNRSKRLITFDSNDPEFDDDYDPDADLDI